MLSKEVTFGSAVLTSSVILTDLTPGHPRSAFLAGKMQSSCLEFAAEQNMDWFRPRPGFLARVLTHRHFKRMDKNKLKVDFNHWKVIRSVLFSHEQLSIHTHTQWLPTFPQIHVTCRGQLKQNYESYLHFLQKSKDPKAFLLWQMTETSHLQSWNRGNALNQSNWYTGYLVQGIWSPPRQKSAETKRSNHLPGASGSLLFSERKPLRVGLLFSS